MAYLCISFLVIKRKTRTILEQTSPLTHVNINEASFFARFLWLYEGSMGIHGHTTPAIVRFSCSGRKRFGKCFLSAFFAGFNPV